MAVGLCDPFRVDVRDLGAGVTGRDPVLQALNLVSQIQHCQGERLSAVCVSCFSVAIVWSRVISQTERAQTITFFSDLVTQPQD